MGRCCEATVTHSCCEAESNPETGRLSKKWRSVCGVGKLKSKEKEKKKDRMRLERQATVSLVFRWEPVGVMRMTLVGGDI